MEIGYQEVYTLNPIAACKQIDQLLAVFARVGDAGGVFASGLGSCGFRKVGANACGVIR
jgi:hypothetical protein